MSRITTDLTFVCINFQVILNTLSTCPKKLLEYISSNLNYKKKYRSTKVDFELNASTFDYKEGRIKY